MLGIVCYTHILRTVPYGKGVIWTILKYRGGGGGKYKGGGGGVNIRGGGNIGGRASRSTQIQ